MKVNSTDFAWMIKGFLTEYLPHQRGYGSNTISSYKDALKKLVQYLSEAGYDLSSFQMKDLDKKLIIQFLEWLRKNGSSSSTANQRLAAIKTFCTYAQQECIECLPDLQDIEGIKCKREEGREIQFLSVDQMRTLINAPDSRNTTGFRHHLILSLLYDSGCRVQELCDLRVGDITLGSDPVIILHGKGDKYRTVPISAEMASLIEQYLERNTGISRLRTNLLITNKNRSAMSRDGVEYIIQKYVDRIRKSDSSFPEHVHPHMFRHSKAMHMLASGVNIVYIRDFLGHENIETTMIYAKADNALKNKAINKLAPKLVNETEFPDWSKDQDLLAYLKQFR